MSEYKFYAGYLRFVASKTTSATTEISDMMVELNRIAGILEVSDTFTVDKNKLRMTARALAGVAGILQQHILPEVTRAMNKVGEVHIRWVIDTSMDLMSNLMVHAELAGGVDDFIAILPKPPLTE